MEKLKHWTNRSEDDFVHAIASDFVAQIETTMEEENMDRKSLATKARVSPGRVSQVLNNPSSLNLRSVVKYARAAKRKVAIVTYDDGDPSNEQGPIDAGVFTASWQNAGCPRDLFELQGVGNGNAIRVLVAQELYATKETKTVIPPIRKNPRGVPLMIDGELQRFPTTLNEMEQAPYAQK